jgi:hypothetical protein
VSEPIPEEGGGGPAAPGFMSRRFFGIPAIFWLLGAIILAYLVFRNRSGRSGGGATGASGQSATGDISIAPATSTYKIMTQFGPNTTTATQHTGKAAPPKHRTHNPQPRPKPRPTKKKHQVAVPVKHGGENENDTGSG